MRIIDRYILRQFVQTFLICFFSLAGLYVVFGAMTNLDSFLEVAKIQGSLLSVIARYYGYQSLFFFDLTAGMLALISAMFTITWLQRHNEMTALLAAGIPRIRAAMPVILAAMCIAALAVVNRELIMPRYRTELVLQPADLTGQAARPFEPCRDQRTNILLWGSASYATQQRIHRPTFHLPETLSRYGTQLTAEDAYYCPADENHPSGYLLQGVEQPKSIATLSSLTLDGKPTIIMPRDAGGWLKPDQCFVASEVTFELLTQGFAFASTAQLIAGLRNPSLGSGAPVCVEIHSRIVQPLLDVTLLFLGLPLVMTRENRNVFIAIGLCVLLVSVFLVVTMGIQSLGANYLISAHLAAWGPLLVFVPVAAGLAGSMWK